MKKYLRWIVRPIGKIGQICGKIWHWKNLTLKKFAEKFDIEKICGKIWHRKNLQKNLTLKKFAEKFDIEKICEKIRHWKNLRKILTLKKFAEKFDIEKICGKIWHWKNLRKNLTLKKFAEKIDIEKICGKIWHWKKFAWGLRTDNAGLPGGQEGVPQRHVAVFRRLPAGGQETWRTYVCKVTAMLVVNLMALKHGYWYNKQYIQFFFF